MRWHIIFMIQEKILLYARLWMREEIRCIQVFISFENHEFVTIKEQDALSIQELLEVLNEMGKNFIFLGMEFLFLKRL